MDTVKILIDGREVIATQGQTVLEAALSSNIYIPHLCTHPDLPVQGNCNLCVIEAGSPAETLKACEAAVTDGMVIVTKSPALTKARNIAMELMLAGHPRDCTSCKVYLNCELQSLMQYLGIVNARMRHIHRETTNINTKNPLIVREMERCVQCGRCIRACRDLRGVDILGYNKQSWETYVGTENDLPLAEAGCRFCGACVEVCPTGALYDAEGIFRTDIPRCDALVPCGAECPAGIDVPRYIRYIKDGKYTQAGAVIREKTPFPHVLGYVCNRRCETVCKRGKFNEAVSIRDLKRFAADNDDEQVWYEKAITPLTSVTGKTVSVIGSGPCGLTAAYYLQKKGHSVTVYERLPAAGGMMAAGIPEYRIPGGIVKKEIDIISETGVTILTNCNVVSAPDLRKECDAVLVAVGASRGKIIKTIPGWDNRSVFTAIDLLRETRLGNPLKLGDTVNIIGGGNVAYDCARTLLRMGKNVNIICLEKGGGMLADAEEIKEAAEEGVRLFDGSVSISIESGNGMITGHKIARVEEFYFDENNRLVIKPITDSECTIPCDSIVFAAGQEPDLNDGFGLELNSLGYPVTDSRMLTTSVEGVFAAGDAVTGSKFVIDAIAEGRKSAMVIDRYLGGDGSIDDSLIPFEHPEPKIGKKDRFFEIQREAAALRNAESRVNDFKPLSVGYTCVQADCEADRCLQCDLRKHISKVMPWTGYTR